MTMKTSLGYEFYDFCGGVECSKIIDLAKKMIERYKGDRTNLYKEMEDMEKEELLYKNLRMQTKKVTNK